MNYKYLINPSSSKFTLASSLYKITRFMNYKYPINPLNFKFTISSFLIFLICIFRI